MNDDEFIEGLGTLQPTEPTTICDVARTFSYITKETLAIKAVEAFLRELGYADAGTYDEDGRWSPPCFVRKRSSYGGTFVPKAEAYSEEGQRTALAVLGWNLWDAHIEYRRCCAEISKRLRELHDKLREETK